MSSAETVTVTGGHGEAGGKTSCGPRVVGLHTYSNPAGDYLREGVQAYFRQGLESSIRTISVQFSHTPICRFPTLVKGLALAKESRKARRLLGASRLERTTETLARIIGGKPRFDASRYSATICRYGLSLDDGTTRSFCIDVADSPEIGDPELLKTSVAYFKTNFAVRGTYPDNVFPLFNVGPDMPGTLRNLALLRGMRKEYDLSFIVRVWGGTNEVDGIEHNLRLIEALSKVRCRKFFHIFLIAGDTQAIAQRLDSQGIRWASHPLSPEECVRVAAQSRLSVVRHAIHSSIPWSTVEKMAVGSCVLLDHDPSMRWMAPLVRDTHFLCMDTDVDRKSLVATEAAYAALPERVEGFLYDPRATEEIGRNAAAYFDAHLTPEKAGEYILATLRTQLARPSLPPR